MATRSEIAYAKKTTELLLAAEGKNYETWLYDMHNRYIAESGDVVQKALEQLVKQKKSNGHVSHHQEGTNS